MRGEADKSAAQTTGKIALLILLILAQVPRVHPDSSLLLHYDDGGAEYFWSDYYPNGIAVEFTPPALKWRITAVLIYGFAVIRGEKSFIVEVRDSDFNLAFRGSFSISNYFKNVTLDWARIPLPSIVVESNFYVCVYPLLEPNRTQLWIAMDNDTVSNRCFLVDRYRQEVRKFDRGNAMIRVEGEEATDLAEITLDSIFVEEESLRVLFRVIATGNVTEVSAALQIGSLTEDYKVTYKEGLYEVAIDWSKLLGLKEPAKLALKAKTLNSTPTLLIKLGEALFSEYLQLKGENKLLRAALNSSRLEQEALRHRIEDKEADMAIMRASLETYEKRLLRDAEEVEKLTREFNAMRLLTGLLGLSAILSFIILRRKSMQARLHRWKEVNRDA
ncbi:MAG: hypothetical protein QXZ66_10425 [Thermoproteota archaeon]